MKPSRKEFDYLQSRAAMLRDDHRIVVMQGLELFLRVPGFLLVGVLRLVIVGGDVEIRTEVAKRA